MSLMVLDADMGETLGLPDGEPTIEDIQSLCRRVDKPEALRLSHSSSLAMGAMVIRTQTAFLSRWRMNMADLADRFAPINVSACEAAMLARDTLNPGALVAGVLGPVRAVNEPDHLPPPALIEAEIAEQALVMAPYVDLFLCQTMSLGQEAAAVARAASSTGRPVWVALSLNGREPVLTTGGETVAQAAAPLSGISVGAWLVSSQSPTVVTKAMEWLKQIAQGAPFGGYAHVAPTEAANQQAQLLDPEAYADIAREWTATGATILGAGRAAKFAHVERLSLLAPRAG
ncbi:MAG: homocysteine S-methyltransferase family protein [Pseudomonadota bacterium]